MNPGQDSLRRSSRINNPQVRKVQLRLKFTRQERLRKRAEFQELYLRGHRLKGPHLTLYYKPNQQGVTRLGLTVSKKRFKLSITRHHIQRWLREAYRLNKTQFRPGYDLVFLARHFGQASTFEQIQNELLLLAKKAKLHKISK